MQATPVNIWEGDPVIGTSFVNGFIVWKENQWRLYQQQWAEPKDIFAKSNCLNSVARSFVWLRDLTATGDVSARRTARRIIEHWCVSKARYTKPRHKIDEMFISATRLSNFILLYDFFGASASDSFKKIFFKSIIKEYRSLKRKYISKCDNTYRLSIIKTFVEYNIYCDYDSGFFNVLFSEIEIVIELINAELVQTNVSVNDTYKRLCLMIELRNALIQWEKSFMTYRDQKSFKLIFSQLQQTLYTIAQIIRFYRHSNGTLCQLNENATSNYFFFEPTKSSNIDIALSQVNHNTVLIGKRRNSILRCSNRQAVLFISIQNKAPVQYPNCYTNIMPNVMNVEWSFHSYCIVSNVFVAILYEHHLSQIKKYNRLDNVIEHTLETTNDGSIFCGISTDNNETYVFRRQLCFCKESIQCIDSVVISDTINDAFLVLNFELSNNLVLHEIKHEEQSFVGEVIFFAQRTTHIYTKSKIVCVFRIETKQLFCIKTKNKENRPIISIITNISPSTTTDIHWSFNIVKQ
jgi:hypothetical protein